MPVSLFDKQPLSRFKDHKSLPDILVLLLLACWKAPFWSMPSAQAVPTFDAVFFLSMARNIKDFFEFGWLGYHEPFFYSLATACAALLFPDVMAAGAIVSQIGIFLFPLVLYLFALNLYNRQIALAAGLLALFHPHILVVRSVQQSEALFLFLITLSSYCLWKSVQKRSHLISALAGLLFCLSYFTRSEGLLVFLLQAALLLICRKQLPTRTVKSVCLSLAIFTIVAAPYIGYLSSHYKTLTLGTKTSSIYFWVREKAFNDPDPDRSEWGLSPAGELNIISMTSRDLLGYWLKDPGKSIPIYLKNLKEELPGFIPNDGAIRHFPQIFPLVLALPLLFGFLTTLFRRECTARELYLAAPLLLLFIYPLLTGGWWRYLLNLLPFFIILSVKGLDTTVKLLFSKQGKLTQQIATWLFIISVLCYNHYIIAAKPVTKEIVDYKAAKSTMAEETRKAGEHAMKMLPKGSNFMAQWTRLPYFLDGRWTAMPAGSLEEIIWYARKNKVDYIAFEVQGNQNFIDVSSQSFPFMQLVTSYRNFDMQYFVLFYKII